ncbi:MAG: hypothetical protein JST55_04605 [Bacteroidetes bacterium]|nr:hypothetical protein [Bacteroidota bacterium]
MKNIFYYTLFLFVFSSGIFAQMQPINMPEVYDNSISLPGSAEQGFNMFTDNTFTTLKSPYQEKITFVKDYEKKIDDYMKQTTEEGRGLVASNDPLMRDTSQEYLNRQIVNLNLEMLDIVTKELNDIGLAQIEFNEQIAPLTDNKEKLKRLNTYISGKYADITNKYAGLLREKLVQIYALYQEINFGSGIRNPLTRLTTISSLFATVDVYVNRRNEAARLTAERLAKDYIAYKN